MVKGSSFRAAIGSKSLIKIEGLRELAFPINDVPGNCTRFVYRRKKYPIQQILVVLLSHCSQTNLGFT